MEPTGTQVPLLRDETYAPEGPHVKQEGEPLVWIASGSESRLHAASIIMTFEYE